MIKIKDNRIWFYSEDVDSELPTLDFKLISAYICPHCDSILSAYFVGSITEKVIEFYWRNDTREYQIGTVKGGSYIFQANHGVDSYRGKNCLYMIARGRGIENCLTTLCGCSSIPEKFIKAIERGDLKDFGLLAVNDMCESDKSILLYDIDKICNGEYKWNYEKEDDLGEGIVKLMESFEDDKQKIELEPKHELQYTITRLGKKKKIELSPNQATLFNFPQKKEV